MTVAGRLGVDMSNAEQRSSFTALLLLLFFALYFYRFGASNIEGLLNYPFWRDMGPMMGNDDFMSLRREHLWKIFPLLVFPMLLLVLVTGALAVRGAPPVPRWVFIIALVCQLINLGSTAFIQVPIQLQLTGSGFNAALLDRLISTDLLFRKLPSVPEAILATYGLWSILSSRHAHARVV